MFELMEQFFDQYQEEIARIALWVCNMASLTGGENMNGLNDELYCILRETFFFFKFRLEITVLKIYSTS